MAAEVLSLLQPRPFFVRMSDAQVPTVAKESQL